MSFLYFIIMIGALVFFHEFGHFIVAKAFDVKVLRFSIGFGPKILGFEYGETEYVICALPLGGYVQMLGHDFGDLEIVEEDEMDRALMAKPIWQRSLVILAGPVANIILPVVIYFIVAMTQAQMPPSLIGEVFDDTPAAAAGLQPGDRIVAIEGKEARYWHDITDAVVDAPGVPLTFTYERDGERHDVEITPETKTSTDFLGLDMRTYGQIGIHLGAYGPTIAMTGPDTPAKAGGLEPFDRVVSVNGEAVERYDELASKIRSSKGQKLDLVVMRPKSIGVDYGEFFRFDIVNASVQPVEVDGTWSIGVVRAQMVVSEILEDSAAAKAGFEAGDRVVALNGRRLSAWDMLVRAIHNEINQTIVAREAGDDSPVEVPFEVTYVRNGETLKTTLTPHVFKYPDQAKQDRYKIDIGWGHMSDLILPDDIDFPLGARTAFAASNSVDETWGYVKMMVRGLARMVQGKVGLDSVGGPILIGELAAKAGEAGAEPFLRMMALISINLAIFNLLPIPILDGGQLTLFAIEAVKRGPISFRTRQIAAYIGFAMIVMIMILAFKNDIERNWDSIVEWVSGD